VTTGSAEGNARTSLEARPGALPALVRRAPVASDLAATVDALPHGLDTPVGARGFTLSGGQRQRLALARALVADPAVLLLDDCTSALDAETESRVRRALAELQPDRTTVIVSHKVASVRAADLIVVLDSGRLIESGPHASLLALGGRYAALDRLQTSALAAAGR
jgi:ABC-type multidrug transport system fused ATPase/permease subunit